MVEVEGHGGVEEDQLSSLGKYRFVLFEVCPRQSNLCSWSSNSCSNKIHALFKRLEEGTWSEGRPVFKMVDKERFLVFDHNIFVS